MGKSLLLALTLVTTVARALSPQITVRDVPGTNNEWQEGSAIIPAPPAQVQGWMIDYDHWQGRFPDIVWAKSAGVDDRGRHIAKFRSKTAGRNITMHEEVKPGMLVFEGWGPDLYTQGRVWLLDAGGGSTRVVIQSTCEVHGFIGLFATKSLRRKSGFSAIQSQLRTLLDLARAR